MRTLAREGSDHVMVTFGIWVHMCLELSKDVWLCNHVNKGCLDFGLSHINTTPNTLRQHFID